MFAQAKTADVGELVSAFPHAYYPESSWEDDLELGATQLALAARKLGDPRANGWARDAAKWAKAYIGSDDTSTLNLYDTSALAHADLAVLLRTGVPGAALGVRELAADLRRQLDAGVESAKKSPFRTAVDVTDFDAASKSFGFAATARLYQRVTGDTRYAAFGAQQRDFTLGANAWGVSLVVGVGTTFPNARTTRPRTSPDLRKCCTARSSTARTAPTTSPICRSPRAPRNAPVRMNPSTAKEVATPTT